MPAFSKAGPGSGRNAGTTPQWDKELLGEHSPGSSHPPGWGLRRLKSKTPLTSADTSRKGEHSATLLSSRAFQKVSSISETLSFAEYIAFCLLVLQTDYQSAKPILLLRGIAVNHVVPPWTRSPEASPGEPLAEAHAAQAREEFC